MRHLSHIFSALINSIQIYIVDSGVLGNHDAFEDGQVEDGYAVAAIGGKVRSYNVLLDSSLILLLTNLD